MSDIIRVSHPRKLYITNWLASGKTEETPGGILSWQSEEFNAPTLVLCIVSLGEGQFFNSVKIKRHKNYPEFFPGRIRFETSVDGKAWEPLLHELEYNVSLHGEAHWNFAPISALYLKFVFFADKKKQNGKYFLALGEVQFLILGTVNIKSSSELDRLWVKENVIDGRPEYGWSTSLRPSQEKEFIELDLGTPNCLCEVRVLSKDDPDTLFPLSFQFFYSEDNTSWHLVFEENSFLAEPGCWYRWRFLPVNARSVRMIITEGTHTKEGKYISQVVEIELYAIVETLGKFGSNFITPPSAPPASTLRPGLVRFSLDGECKEGIAVQASDRRLKDATTERKGIVELASDGEQRNDVVVQGNDRRLKYATEEMPGIVRLARSEEVRAGHVVQSNDPRLELSTEDKAGLVELASDGESRTGVAVQGNDRRLRYATINNPGIVRLADNNSDKPNEVVQGNDARLRLATVESTGIVRLARASEAASDAVLRSNDPRLRPATTETKGFVELAADREMEAGKVVQGNDSRLTRATEKKAGIVQLALPGSSMENCVVQANDPRLFDARKPMPHSHDHVIKEHSHNSHTGTIKLETQQGKITKGIHKPSVSHAPIVGINNGDGAGVMGNGQRDGIVGAGKSGGVVGLGLEDGHGIIAVASRSAAGVFLSEGSYSIIAGGNLKDRGVEASVLALLAKGASRFNDTIYSYSGLGCIASYFAFERKEVLSPGDLVAINETGKQVYRPRSYGDLNVVGVVVQQAAIVLNPPEELLPNTENIDRGPFTFMPLQDKALVAVGGIVEVQVKISKKSIRAGDLLVSSSEPGIVERLDTKRYQPGMVFARSLESPNKEKAKVRALLTTF